MNLKVVHLGIAGFPHNITLAPVQKSYLIYKGLVHAGDDVLFINTMPLSNHEQEKEKMGSYDGIRYIYTCNTPNRPTNVFKRNWLKLVGTVNEFFLLSKLKRDKEVDVAILYTASFLSLLYYRVLTNIVDIPLVMNYVEYRSSIKTKKRTKALENCLTDRFSAYLVDGMLPISEFLIQQIRKTAPKLPILKIPVLCDFSNYDNLHSSHEDSKYVLYCGSAAYYKVVRFIVSAFELLEDHTISLYLIVNGWPYDLAKVEKRIAASEKREKIKVFSNVPSKEYSQLLSGAQGLLVPLRSNVQDQARFPNKIGEYIASGNPIITTAVGEVEHYFTDKKNALIAENYDITSFSEKINFVIDQPEKARQIGLAGKKLGQDTFDYQLHGKRLSSFLHDLVNR